MRYLYISLFSLLSFNALGQKTKLQIAHNSVGKLQASIANKEDIAKQLSIVGEGLKAIESAEADKKTKNWAETWSIKSYLSSFVAITDKDDTNADKYYEMAIAANEKAKQLDKYQDNAGLIKSSDYNINIKRQYEGNQSFNKNDFTNAFKNLKQVSDFMPKDTAIAVNVAICAQNIQAYNDAITYFKRAKENGVKNPMVFQHLSKIYASKFDNDQAIKTLEEGLALNPYNSFLTNDYINLLLDNEKYEKALAAIDVSILADKKNKILYYLQGYLNQEKFNNNKNAKLAYDKALTIDQSYFDALYQLSLIYLDNANQSLKENNKEDFSASINRAELALLKANEINVNDRNTIQLLIEVYTRKNKLDKVQDLKRKLNEF